VAKKIKPNLMDIKYKAVDIIFSSYAAFFSFAPLSCVYAFFFFFVFSLFP